MATAKTTARRKPAAKKRTTAKKTPPKAVEAPAEEQINQEYDPAWHATVEAYVTLRDAGAQIPDAIRIPVEKWIKDQEEKYRIEQAKLAEAAAKQQKIDEEGPKWIRSCLAAEFTLRIGRRDKDKSRRIELKPRGQRGDLFPLEEGDEKDPDLRASVRDGYIEILGQRAADEIINHQTENIQRVHSPIAILRNERGEPGQRNPDGSYTGFNVEVATEWNKQGVVVGVIDKSESQKHGLGTIHRPEQRQQFYPTGPAIGGNPAIVSDGFAPKLSENAQAEVADDLARKAKGRQNTGETVRPEQALGLAVTVGPTQRT